MTSTAVMAASCAEELRVRWHFEIGREKKRQLLMIDD